MRGFGFFMMAGGIGFWVFGNPRPEALDLLFLGTWIGGTQ